MQAVDGKIMPALCRREPQAQVLEAARLCKTTAMTYKVILHESDEGFAVSCPALPGCWSQGADEEEAIANIRDAIREYLAALDSASIRLLRTA